MHRWNASPCGRLSWRTQVFEKGPPAFATLLTRARETAMNIHVMGRTYNTYGGHPDAFIQRHFLLVGAPDFGSAIQEIERDASLPA